MHEKISDMQNTIWKIYKELLVDKDMGKCNEKLQKLAERYCKDELSDFCQNLIVTWTPIFNQIKKGTTK